MIIFPPQDVGNFNDVSIGLYLTVRLKDPLEEIGFHISQYTLESLHHSIESNSFQLPMRGDFNYTMTQELCETLGKI